MTSTSDLEFLEARRPRFIFCGVDMQVPGTRPRVALLGIHLQIPVVFSAISRDGDWGYVFVQSSRKGEACFNCIYKEAEESQKQAHGPAGEQRLCPGVPSTCDIQKTLAGIALYAIDSLIMARPRDWNLWTLSLSKSEFGGASFVTPRPDCAVCNQRLVLQYDDSVY